MSLFAGMTLNVVFVDFDQQTGENELVEVCGVEVKILDHNKGEMSYKKDKIKWKIKINVSNNLFREIYVQNWKNIMFLFMLN